jgi:glycosyl transferase family 4/glycosyl transferase family 1
MRKPPGVCDSPSIIAVAWDHHQGRTEALANALGGRAWYIRSRPTQKGLLPLRYLVDAIQMWRLLSHHRPEVLLAVTPPLGPPLVGWLWCLTHDCSLVIDCHTGAFHSWKWRWAAPLLRLACRRAAAALVHTRGDEELVQAWGAVPVLLPDDLPEPSLAAPTPVHDGPCVVVAGSLDSKEPVAATVEAARLLPEVTLRFTGEPARVPAAVRRGAPRNADFPGWLDYPDFLGELLRADVVAVFSTDPHIMNRAAFEAVGLGRPLVLTDFAGLRSRFGSAALFSSNEPEAIADVLRVALRERDDLAARSMELQARLRAQHQEAVARLQEILATASHASLHPQGSTDMLEGQPIR